MNQICDHKFRTNLDQFGEAITEFDRAMLYMTVIFCEKCGLVTYDKNRSSDSQEYQKALQRRDVTPTMLLAGFTERETDE